MQGLYFLLTLVFFGVVIRWYTANEHLAPGESTKGLLRMEREPSATQKAAGGSARRPSELGRKGR